MTTLHADRIQLTTDFNDLMARHSTVIYTLQIFEMNEREREGRESNRGCVYICATRTSMIASKRKRERENGREGERETTMLKNHLLLYVSHSITIQ